ncbi:hypothetical protein AK812_SmicGene2942 [Symbiodinium microadriaticum]|uniref:Uncharacterized protein n=1 Tax=Symbiodinium microadriaticum TaxID=2951 RepID=A0A1Q9F0G5_SYMMI|nr:hypothetical protein AK812_SmicGene2942 [Symbiodinium microadriaticum]
MLFPSFPFDSYAKDRKKNLAEYAKLQANTEESGGEPRIEAIQLPAGASFHVPSKIADIVAASADAPSQSILIVDGGGARGGGILQLQRRSSKAAGSREQELGSEEHRLDDVLRD